MRDILFRGKRIDNGKWVYGFYSRSELGHHISPSAYCGLATSTSYNVISKTVGQFTGVFDKNDNKIFEGDIVRYMFNDNDYLAIVEYCELSPSFLLRRTPERFGCDVEFDFSKGGMCRLEIVGNIHDNPELLKEA